MKSREPLIAVFYDLLRDEVVAYDQLSSYIQQNMEHGLIIRKYSSENFFKQAERLAQQIMIKEVTEKINMDISGNGHTRQVFIDSQEVNPTESQSYINHSPDGFNWGYGGSGPSQLALAIMLKLVKDPNDALQLYQDFKNTFLIQMTQGKDFRLEVQDIIQWIMEQGYGLQTIKEKYYDR